MKKLEFAGMRNVWHVDSMDDFYKVLQGKSTLLFVKHLDEKSALEFALKERNFKVKPFTLHGPLSSDDSNYVLMASLSQITGYKVHLDQVAFFKAPSLDMVKQGQARVSPYHNHSSGELVPANSYVYHPLASAHELTSSVFAALHR